MKRLIVTADDFGRSTAVNEAIEEGHRKGILTTASLMVSEHASKDAVARAHSLPRLRVGLHVALVDARATLPSSQIPDLVDPTGVFSPDLVRAGCRFFFLPRVRRQLEAEVRAQFEAFRASGLTLDHVNAHHHMQLHPTVFDCILRVGREYGLGAMRLPDEPPLEALCDAAELARRRRQRLLLRPWVSRLRSRLDRSGIVHNDYLFGLYDTGEMDVEKLVRVMAHLPDGVSELLLHPAKGPVDAPLHTREKVPGHEEYRALLHPRVRRAIEKFGVELGTFDPGRGATTSAAA